MKATIWVISLTVGIVGGALAGLALCLLLLTAIFAARGAPLAAAFDVAVGFAGIGFGAFAVLFGIPMGLTIGALFAIWLCRRMDRAGSGLTTCLHAADKQIGRATPSATRPSA